MIFQLIPFKNEMHNLWGCLHNFSYRDCIAGIINTYWSVIHHHH